MKKLYFLSFLFGFTFVNAQLPDWSTAPDFSLPDLDDDYHDLYDYLDDGYSVVLDFSATWCGPCWNYHQSGILEELYDEYGPGGEDNVMVFMIEADPGTSQPCIYGPSNCSGGSIGDWTAGVNYPILNPGAAEAADVNADFNINYYPTLYGVAPNGDIYEVGQAGFSEWESWVAESFQMHNTTWERNEEDCTDSFIDLQPAGGHGVIQYEWSNGATTQDLFDIAPGDYYVTMTDDNDYEVIIGPIEIENNNGAELMLMDAGNVLCNGGEEGYIEIDFGGGSGDFEFEWSNGSDEPNLEDLPAGDYELVMTDVNTGCEFELEVEIEEPEELEYEIEIEQPICGVSDIGEVEFFVDGGTWPITFFYEDYDTRDDYAELPPGDYQVTIEDFNGCQLVAETFTINSADAPFATSSSTGLFNCVTDTVYVAVDSSSTGPDITYTWLDPSMTVVGTDSLVQIDSAGVYTLQVTNTQSGCVSESSVMVMEDYTDPSASAMSLNDIDCNNNTATLMAETSNPDPNLVYSWSTADGNILTDPNQTQVEVGSSGTYMLTVAHSLSGCESMTSIEVEAVDVPEIFLEGETEFCQGSNATICVEQSTDQEVRWSVDGNIISTSNCVTIDESADIEIVLSNMSTGCESVELVSTEAYELPSTLVDGELSFCSGSSTQLCLNNSGNSTINWFDGGQPLAEGTCLEVSTDLELEVVVTNNETGCTNSRILATEVNANPEINIQGDFSLCEGSMTSICLELGNDEEVSWRVNGEDLGTLSCIEVTEEVELEVMVQNLVTTCVTTESFVTQFYDTPELNIVTPELLGCDDPETLLDLEVNMPYTSVNWIDSSGELIDTEEDILVSEVGQYTAVVISENGCESQLSTIVELDPLDLPDADISIEENELTLVFNTEIEGIFNNVLWEFGDGTTSNEVNPTHTYTEPGYYMVNLVVENDCGQTTIQREVLAVEKLTLSTVVSDVSCNGLTDGKINLSPFGGLKGYELNWDGGTEVFDDNLILDNLAPGSYTILLTDQSGQEIETEIEITEPEAITVGGIAEGTPMDENVGSIVIDVSGGSGDYAYSWSNGSTDRDQFDLARGDYTVVVTDSNGCQEQLSFSVGGTTSVHDNESQVQFSVIPNPAIDFINLSVELNTSSNNAFVRIFDSLGKQVYRKALFQNTFNQRLDISGWDNGLYFVELRNGNDSKVAKIFVSK
jgi:hypothetical protein